MIAAAAANSTTHAWHLVEGTTFLLVAIAAAAVADARARTRDNDRPSRPAGAGRAALRICAVSAAGAAAVHFAVMPGHFSESALYGWFFLVIAVLQLTWAAAVLVHPTRRLLLVGATANAAVVILWLVTRLVAVPLGPLAGETETFGALDLVASGLEFVTVVTTTWSLTRPALPLRQSIRVALLSRPLLLGLTAAMTLVTATAFVSPPS